MEIIPIIICLLFIVFFSSLIVAYTYSNKIYLNLESKKESITSYTLKVLAENPRLYISSLKVGNTICLVIFSFYFFNFFSTNFQQIAITYGELVFWITAIFSATILVYIFSKFIPQTFVKPFANQILVNSNLSVKILIKIFSPITKPFLKLSDKILSKGFNLSQDKENQLLSIGELGSYITKQMEAAEVQENLDTELQILKNALAFTDVLVKDVMTPRLEIESVDINDSLEAVQQKFIDTGFSKLLVYEDKLDNIIGYVHIFELLESPTSIKNIMYPIEIVAETTYVKELFQRLSVKRKSIAMVVDEYGGLSGIITIEDIIEELFGEINDEHDEITELIEKQIAPNKFIVSGRLDVEYINKKFNLNLLESESYNTIGGYILFYNHEIPKKGDCIEIEKFKFKILSSSEKKIEIIEIITNE